MLTLLVPQPIASRWSVELQRAGAREIGGVLMGEHVGADCFRVCDVTVHAPGTFASFIRALGTALRALEDFFSRTNRNYRKFNYLGEWHSHPSFRPEPSSSDDESMKEIVMDPKVGANFAALAIIKLDQSGTIIGSVHGYLPSGEKERGQLEFEA